MNDKISEKISDIAKRQYLIDELMEVCISYDVEYFHRRVADIYIDSMP